MNPRHAAARFAVPALAALGTGGCAFPTSPSQEAAPPAPLSAGQVAGLGAGTAVGAIAGDKIGGGTGALIGGAVGLAGAALLENASAAASDREAIEEARREERLKVMQEYWRERTEGPGGGTAAAGGPPPLLEYPAGNYGGINFGPRLAPDPSLAEPSR